MAEETKNQIDAATPEAEPKKPAAKKAAPKTGEKKPTAKKTAVKADEEKPAAAKKTTAKKTTAAKADGEKPTAAKKTTTKKTTTAKADGEKPAAAKKTTAKKPAAKPKTPEPETELPAEPAPQPEPAPEPEPIPEPIPEPTPVPAPVPAAPAAAAPVVQTIYVEKKSQPKIIILLCAIAVLLIAVAVLITVLILRPAQLAADNAIPGYEREVTARLGQLENKSEEEIQAELNRVIEEGMFHIAINADPVFDDGESLGSLRIENVPNNHYLMRVEINLQDTGELVYSTKYIEPNNHIEMAKLDVPLEKGEYFAVATFYAYTPDTLTEMGSVASVITLHILN